MQTLRKVPNLNLLGSALTPHPMPCMARIGLARREFVIEDEERPLPVTVWYPAQEGVEETTYVHDPSWLRMPIVKQPGHAIPDGTIELSDAPYPLVIYSSGNMWYRQAAAYLAEHLASHGFVVMAADHTGNTLAYLAVSGALYTNSIVNSMAYRPMRHSASNRLRG